MVDCEQSLRKILEKIAAERHYDDSAISIQAITSGTNYTSKLYNATISRSDAKTPDLHLFGKVAALSKEIRDSMDIENSNTEFYFYLNLLKKYREIESLYNLTDNERLNVPVFYGFDPTELKETIVLENVTANGYISYKLDFDWEYASAAVKELAKFHALSFAFKELHPDDYKIATSNGNIYFNTEIMSSFMDGPIVQALYTVKQEYKGMLKNYIDSVMKKRLRELYEPVEKPVICHLDYRASNLMYRRREEGQVEVKIVDFQTLREASPVTDLLYFIFTSSDEQFRAQYYEQLVEHYYSQLADAMLRLHLDPEQHYSRAVFNHELKMKLPFGLSIAVMTLPIIAIEAKKAAAEKKKASNTEGQASIPTMKTGDLYSNRLHGVINDFIKWRLLS